MLIPTLRTYLRPYIRPIALIVLLQLTQTFATLSLPTLNADLVDNGVVTGDTGHVLRTGMVMLSVTLVQILCATGAVYVSARTAMALGRDLRGAVFAKVQHFSEREMVRFGAPSLITRTTNDVQQLQLLVLMGFTMMVVAPVMGAGAVLMALHQDLPLSLLLLVVLPVLITAIVLILRRMGPLSGALQKRLDRVNAVVREQITGMRVVRAFVRERYERERFAGANDALLDTGLRLGHAQALMMPTVMLITEVSGIAVVWFGGHRIADGSMPIGALIAFLHYLTQILQAVMMATMAFLLSPRARVCAERIQEILRTEPAVAPPARPVHALPHPGHLEVRDAGFRHPGAEEPVLRGVSLLARPGETTAVVGSTGSGKSTLLHLVPRLFDTTGGSVRVGGVDVRELDPVTLAATVALVPQRASLFSGTIASNLRYGDPGATGEELWHALEVAQAADFVAALPDGLDAPIGQGGANVSGGQRQRLAVARALVARPDIYLFDDSFSALDQTTERRLRTALARETVRAAVVIVAQRVATVREADRIVVLGHGRVLATGTHHELMRSAPAYREFVLSQLTEEEAAV